MQHPSELVAVVNENNEQVGSCTRGQMRAENLIHRCSFVAIFNPQVGQPFGSFCSDSGSIKFMLAIRVSYMSKSGCPSKKHTLPFMTLLLEGL